ncbi:hypothetical protein KR50_07060 [Jeotgalibacillus campisalis]|uniref:Uncharacterized protein n=1 Tax=Jeotgalibacillus campisalis TaxID=220754 RepID=A0A0C2RKR4_9BACL|nr:hypothetical protein KR50_07060 [Jeotgalibacillus campisalis]
MGKPCNMVREFFKEIRDIILNFYFLEKEKDCQPNNVKIK